MAATADRATRRFAARFKCEREAFVRAIAGIAEDEQRARYASLLLTRLMGAYFIQRRGWLAGDRHYLRHQLERMQARAGDDDGAGANSCYGFYRAFLLPLFHHGLGQPPADARPPDVAALIGDVPSLDSGLFAAHPIEAANPAIGIPDAAFARLFAFFDAYEWRLGAEHADAAGLDHRDRRDSAITPDVLGYVCEQQSNQKQIGAYYTGEDVTGYIGRNTIIPHLLDTARRACPAAFAPDGTLWRLLRDDPDRYLYAAVRHGVDAPLPAAIAAGLEDVSQRGGWNRPADPAYALPTETWREHVARRTRCLELRARLAAGEVTDVNDLITLNLDSERFARDAIARCEGLELLRAFWRALTSITILDPTCGSGAFLVAALDLLAPLYEACLERMQTLVAGRDRADDAREDGDLREVVAQVAAHPSRRYYALKTIITRNLYGVDIMEQACAIARLRLVLKLAAQVEDARQIEPLPALAQHIRAGNALAGCAASDQQQPFAWSAAFPAILAARGGFDVIAGNPPYVEYRAARGSGALAGDATEGSGNLAALVCERALELLAPAGRLGLIVPLSTIATQRMRPLQDLIFTPERHAWVSAYDVYPSKLFAGAKQRLTILLLAAAGAGDSSDGAVATPAILSTRYARWKPAERAALFPSLTYHPSNRDARLGVVPKLGDQTAAGVLRKLDAYQPAPFVAWLPAPSLYVHRIPYNYVTAVDFVPFFRNALDGRKRSADYKPYYLRDSEHARIMLAVLNSNLFFWWWYTLFEGYHCGRHEIVSFPIGLDRLDPATAARLVELSRALMADLKAHAVRREATYKATGRVRYDELSPRRSKPILDQIDTALAPHYGFTAAELDAIVNFDIKYRAHGTD